MVKELKNILYCNICKKNINNTLNTQNNFGFYYRCYCDFSNYRNHKSILFFKEIERLFCIENMYFGIHIIQKYENKFELKTYTDLDINLPVYNNLFEYNQLQNELQNYIILIQNLSNNILFY